MHKLSKPLTALDQHLTVQNRKPLTWHSRCLGCQQAFMADAAYTDLCPACQAKEDAMYRVEHTGHAARADAVEDTKPWPWSRAAMRERLGVTGDVDE